MRVATITISAGNSVKLPGGNFFTLISTSAEVDVQLISRATVIPNGDAVGVTEGYWSKPPPPIDGGLAFTEVKVTSATTQTIKYGIASGEGGTNSVTGVVDALITSPNTITTTADATAGAAAAIIAAANANRREVLLQALAGNTQNVRIGDSNITATRGYQLVPGASVVWTVTDDVYAIREAAGTVQISITELSEV